jgi:3-methyladenine DNA glycosylase AlkD
VQNIKTSTQMPPTLKSTLAQLESLGNDKVRALNIRNGAGPNQFGVKLGDIRKVAAKIKSDNGLPALLWATGNLDARLLAVLLIKPKTLTRAELDRMVRTVDAAQLADWLQAYVTKVHPENEVLRQAWMHDDDKWAARAGWSLTAGRVARRPDGLDLTALLDRIEAEMGGAVPEKQWTMNTCLANIGIHHPTYRTRALAIGEQIGAFRDYPVSKGCTSPFAPIWINEMVRRGG